jgi:hypothetical protein
MPSEGESDRAPYRYIMACMAAMYRYGSTAEEYGLFEDSRRRMDLLALDHTGTLVVIELKRTDDGGHMELQALR